MLGSEDGVFYVATSRSDPYRVLFPVGLAHALVGTGLWILYARHVIAYPATAHAHYMFSGFLLSLRLASS